MEWCVRERAGANHPPVVKLAGDGRRTARVGETVELDVSGSSDPDGDGLKFEWVFYAEAGGYAGESPVIGDAGRGRTSVVVPKSAAGESLHFIAVVSDEGKPALTRYARVVVDVSK
jgi:hypothetical protein